jgi:hypothetical protein
MWYDRAAETPPDEPTPSVTSPTELTTIEVKKRPRAHVLPLQITGLHFEQPWKPSNTKGSVELHPRHE